MLCLQLLGPVKKISRMAKTAINLEERKEDKFSKAEAVFVQVKVLNESNPSTFSSKVETSLRTYQQSG